MTACRTQSTGVKPTYERLSPSIRPSHYTLRLAPCLKTFALAGQVDIEVRIEQETPLITLHSDGLVIRSVAIKTEAQLFSDVRWETRNELLTLTPSSAVPAGKATISIAFTGELGKQMKGFYRSVYKGEDGRERCLASTQFASTYARQAFPCFDEPAMKASFDVELVVDERLTALSNMNVLSISPAGGALKLVRFATTPVMSSYLLAIAVGELECVEAMTSEGTLIRVYTTEGKREQGEFALGIAKQALEWYAAWFAIPYALPKCDLVAIPDFHFGAMENWGLITFREVSLLFDARKTSSVQKARIALVVSHELAHLWFGDLVTMEWWTDLWLNEGFACFMSYLCVHYNFPEYAIWMKFGRDEISNGMHLDALRNSHPIEVEIGNPNEVDEIFDAITYAKSNCVNRMLCEYLGEDVFQAGLRIYLRRHVYKNAATIDLWTALAEASGQDIAALMSGWTRQMGFPLISVTEIKREAGSRVLSLRQTRFIVDGSRDESGSEWMVPITCLVGPGGAAAGAKSVLRTAEGTITIHVQDGEYVKLNANSGGFYRVAYDGPMFDALVKSFHTLPSLDRFGFAADCVALMVAGCYSAAQFLSLVAFSCSGGEAEFAVWAALDDGLEKLASVLGGHPNGAGLGQRLDAFVVHALVPVLERLGWTKASGEDSQRGQLRSLLINRLARSGHEVTIQAALAVFTDKGAELEADIRGVVFAIAAREGTVADYDQLKVIFETCGFSEVERNAMMAMGQCEARRAEYLRYAFKEERVRSQDLVSVLVGTASTKGGQREAWDYFKREQGLMLARLGATSNLHYQRALKSVTEGFCSEEEASEVESFFRSCPALTPDAVAALDRPLKQVLETISANARLLSANVSSADEFLASKGF